MIILEIKLPLFIHTVCSLIFFGLTKDKNCIKFIICFTLNIFINSILLYTYCIILFVYNSDSKVIFT